MSGFQVAAVSDEMVTAALAEFKTWAYTERDAMRATLTVALTVGDHIPDAGKMKPLSPLFATPRAEARVGDLLARFLADSDEARDYQNSLALKLCGESATPRAEAGWTHVKHPPKVGGLYVVGGYVSDGVLPRGFERTFAHVILLEDGPSWSHCDERKARVPIEYWLAMPPHPEHVEPTEAMLDAAFNADPPLTDYRNNATGYFADISQELGGGDQMDGNHLERLAEQGVGGGDELSRLRAKLADAVRLSALTWEERQNWKFKAETAEAEVTRLTEALTEAREVVDAALENRPSYSWTFRVRQKIDAVLRKEPTGGE